MKKNLLISVFGFLLCGCFSWSSHSDWKTQKFKVSNAVFSYSLPKNWQTVSHQKQKGEILIAQNEDENFIIQIKNHYQENLSEIILSSFHRHFFDFKLIENDKNTWHFIGKPEAKLPRRDFWQKIIPIPNTDQYLYGSCSHEILSSKEESDCEDIIRSFVSDKP